ncbi:MAG: asnS [Nitrososphaeraceae archaeon]|jgi:asparaginyl-tRNA synthetase|nr:asnS [Nitrososphaeraceae archaeon]
MLRADALKSADYIGKSVTIRGWVYRLRKQKENTFLIVRDDRGGVIQSVLPTSIVPANLTIESSVQITGVLNRDKRAPEGGYEIRGNNIKIFNIADSDYPIGEFQSVDLLLDNRHLALRARKMVAIAKIRASVLKLARNWFIMNDWMEITAPIIVKGAVEGGATLFKINYFGNDYAYLSQSAQLYLEAMVFSLGRVWSMTPSFRAESSRTVRHLSEFTHLEAEAPWVELEDVLKVQEELISEIIKNIIVERQAEFALLKRDISTLDKIKPPFERISYEKAIDYLRSIDFTVLDKDGRNRKIELGDDLNIDSERELTKEALQPKFIVGYPLKVKPFYIKEDPQNVGYGLAVDMLAPDGFGEITSGGMREDNNQVLTTRMQKEGLDINNYQWYLDLRRYGSVPHGGFGLGIERLIRWIIRIDDIKDAVLFPRTMSRVSP